MSVTPIDQSQRRQVIAATAACLEQAGELFGRSFAAIPVEFDLRGAAAGMYRVARGRRWIRYNPYLFAKYFEDSLGQTVPHEVAHYVTDCIYGLRRVRPHGREWRAIMTALGAEPRATGRYDLDGIPTRRQRRFSYRCACPRLHQLTTRRHNMVARGVAAYLCRQCGAPLVYHDN